MVGEKIAATSVEVAGVKDVSRRGFDGHFGAGHRIELDVSAGRSNRYAAQFQIRKGYLAVQCLDLKPSVAHSNNVHIAVVCFNVHVALEIFYSNLARAGIDADVGILRD